MALWGEAAKKADQIDLATHMEAVVKARLFEEENKKLHAQIDRLQEALVAATAAKAYESMQNAKYNIDTKLSPEQEALLKKQKQESEWLGKLAEAQEQPLFTDADEMINALSRNIKIAVGDDPIQPGNSES